MMCAPRGPPPAWLKCCVLVWPECSSFLPRGWDGMHMWSPGRPAPGFSCNQLFDPSTDAPAVSGMLLAAPFNLTAQVCMRTNWRRIWCRPGADQVQARSQRRLASFAAAGVEAASGGVRDYAQGERSGTQGVAGLLHELMASKVTCWFHAPSVVHAAAPALIFLHNHFLLYALSLTHVCFLVLCLRISETQAAFRVLT